MDSNNKAHVATSNDGRAVYFIFANGKESLIFESQEEALFALKQCFDREKINKEELGIMFKQIMLVKDLPKRSEVFTLPIIIVEFITNLEKISEQLGKTIGELEKKVEDIPRELSVKMCECGAGLPHAYIMDGDNEVSPLFLSKEDIWSYLDHILKHDEITDIEHATLKSVADLLPLIESIQSN